MNKLFIIALLGVLFAGCQSKEATSQQGIEEATNQPSVEVSHSINSAGFSLVKPLNSLKYLILLPKDFENLFAIYVLSFVASI